jgi:hypothetical protein
MEASFKLVKNEDFKNLGLRLPIITLFGDSEKTQFLSADSVRRKLGDDRWTELASKYSTLMVEASLIEEDFDVVNETFFS